jgi:hypothetical protein
MELKDLVADCNRMTSIIPSTESGNNISIRGKQVCYMTFTLISPLSANENINGHIATPKK